METVKLGNSKENPLLCIYMKILKSFLLTTGSWPGEGLGQHVSLLSRYLRRHVPVQTTIVLIGQINYLLKYGEDLDFFVVGHCYLTTFFSVITIVRSALPSFKSYEIIVKTFVYSFHLGHYKHKSNYCQKIYSTVEKISGIFGICSVLLMLSGFTFFNIPVIYKNYMKGAFNSIKPENITLEFSVHYTYPGFKPEENFMFVTIVNFYLTYNCSVVLCYIDLLLSVLVFQIIGHILVLRDNLKLLPSPSKRTLLIYSYGAIQETLVVDMYDAHENLAIHKILVKWMDYHKLIIKFTHELSTCFGPILGLNYAFHMVGCCLLLFECSRGDPEILLGFAPVCVIVFGQLILVSVTFEIVGTESEKLKDALYDIAWECMDSRNRRTVCILLNRLQIPIHVYAMKLTAVGVTTMVAVLRATLSYLAILLSMKEE